MSDQLNEEEMKKLHGEDVELGQDDSEDEHLPEAENPPIKYMVLPADSHTLSDVVTKKNGQPMDYDDRETAEAELKKLDHKENYQIVEHR